MEVMLEVLLLLQPALPVVRVAITSFVERAGGAVVVAASRR
jgi:hypothetical protein